MHIHRLHWEIKESIPKVHLYRLKGRYITLLENIERVDMVTQYNMDIELNAILFCSRTLGNLNFLGRTFLRLFLSSVKQNAFATSAVYERTTPNR